MWKWILRISGVFLVSTFFLTSPASADPHFYFGFPGVSIGFGHPHYYYPGYYYPGYAYPYPGYVYGYPGYGYGWHDGHRVFYGHRYYGGGRYVRHYNGHAVSRGGHWHR